MDVDDVKEGAKELLERLSSVIIGLDEELELVLACLLADGHVLLEGVPGVAKTTIVRALVRLLGLERFNRERLVLDGAPFRGWSRIQFTPDLMPSDIVGSLVFNPVSRAFEPRFGPVFAYVVLADEVNRAVPRTQSALLQAMQEREVTIGKATYPLEIREEGKFFFVLATQNPIEQEGTYPLPEAQLDRFLMRVIIPYPRTLEDEKRVYRLHMYRLTEPLEDLEPVVDPSWVVRAQEVVAKRVAVSEEALEYVTRLIRATRPSVFEPISRYFELGASPRAGISLIRSAKAYAAISGSGEVRIRDVDSVAFHVLNHRVSVSTERLIEEAVGGEIHLARYRVIEEGLALARKAALSS